MIDPMLEAELEKLLANLPNVVQRVLELVIGGGQYVPWHIRSLDGERELFQEMPVASGQNDVAQARCNSRCKPVDQCCDVTVDTL
jgi:hypothetical protein